jgi:hypothetical protein
MGELDDRAIETAVEERNRRNVIIRKCPQKAVNGFRNPDTASPEPSTKRQNRQNGDNSEQL